MITPLLMKTLPNKRLWNGKPKHIKRNCNLIRKGTAKKLGNPRLKKVTLGSFRHFVGTMTYHKTKDIFYTKQVLGHKNIQNTMVYVHMINFESDEWVCKVAENVDEAGKLVEAGFEYVCDFGGVKMFRKRK